MRISDWSSDVCSSDLSGVKIILIDERGEGRRDVFEYEGGIASFVEHLAQLKTPLHPNVISVSGEEAGITVDVAIQWTDSYQEAMFCFTNNIDRKSTRLNSSH